MSRKNEALSCILGALANTKQRLWLNQGLAVHIQRQIRARPHVYSSLGSLVQLQLLNRP